MFIQYVLTVQPVSVLVRTALYLMTFQLQGNPYYHTINSVPGPVHCIAQDGSWLALGSGRVVQLVKQETVGAFRVFYLLETVLTHAIHSYLGKDPASSRPPQVPRARWRAPRTHGAFPPLLRRW